MESKEQGRTGEAQKIPTAEDKNQKDAQKVGGDETLEQIGKYRGIAQQNSMEAIKAAQDRYQKAKQTGGAHGTESAGT